MKKPKILFLGPVPPPVMGPTVATGIILRSRINGEFELIHLDTSDHRDLNRLGAVDRQNICLAIKHYLVLVRLICTRWPAMVYIPICQTTLGYFRDAGFIAISRLFGRKVLCHLRGGNFRNWYDSLGPITKRMVRLIHSMVDGQIVLGESLRHLFDGLVPEERIFVVPNGADFSLPPAGRVSGGKIRVLYLANFKKSKGVMDVLLAAAELREHKNRLEFILAGSSGDSELADGIEKFLAENADLDIRLTGPVEGREKEDIMASADIFVFPTYYPAEGHPWVIVEAMAHGLPVIATRQGVIHESVVDGVNGFLAVKKDPVDIASKIRILADDDGMRREMGRESRRLYLENYTEEKMTGRLAETFWTVLGNGLHKSRGR